jgi:methyl-accepting chemotaxis protein
MSQSYTVKTKLILCFAIVTALTVALAILAAVQIRGVSSASQALVRDSVHNLITVEKVTVALTREDSALRGFLISGAEKYLDEMAEARRDLEAARAELAAHAFRPEEKEFLACVARMEAEYARVAAHALELKKAGADAAALAKDFNDDIEPRRREYERACGGFAAAEEAHLAAEETRTADGAAGAVRVVLGIALLAVLAAVAVVLLLGRGITRQIGLAIQSVQSSSAELTAAANQQAAGTKQQSTATTEVTTTLKELVATARQMAESSQRVTRIAEETGGAAAAGDVTLQNAQGSIGAIKRQVDLIVTHMLDLGKKSQQVGGILEIINELAEQTNILAINASIESAGAGESGRRFAVVADEIRRLADRVGGSTKEIRGLIDEIRSAANTTVMVTEDGLKAVDAGTRQFGEVASAFRAIAEKVDTTTGAAREIELGTKQQVTAIEQVNVALRDIAQAARETEASTRQTLQTSGELATLSRNLSDLIRRRVTLTAAS